MDRGVWQVEVKTRSLITPGGERLRLGSVPLFTLIAYLAFERTASPPQGGWVELREIATLPGWRSHSADSIGKEIQRYIRGRGAYPIAYEKITRGPYRFDAPPGRITFDLPSEVREMLGICDALQPGASDESAPYSLAVMDAVRSISLAEGTRYQGWSRAEYLEAAGRLRSISKDIAVPASLRFLALDRILTMLLYSQSPDETESTVEEAERVAAEGQSEGTAHWMQSRLSIHRVRLLLRFGKLQDADQGASQAMAAVQRESGGGDTRTVADLYNAAGIARTRISQGDREIARQALGLLYRALELRIISLNWDEVHDSCLNVAACLANDLGEIELGLRWMAVADVVREACGVGAYSGLSDFVAVSMIRRFPTREMPLQSKAVKRFLLEVGMLPEESTSVEELIEERLELGFRRSRDFDDERGLLMGYRTRAYIRWLQTRPREAFEDVISYVHTAKKLGEEVKEEELRLPNEPWRQPLEQLYHWAWSMRMKSKPVGDVPAESLASYLEEYSGWVEERLKGDAGEGR